MCHIYITLTPLTLGGRVFQSCADVSPRHSGLTNNQMLQKPNIFTTVQQFWFVVLQGFFLRFSFNGSLSEFSTAWPGGVDGGGDRANGKFQRENKKTEITNRANSVFLGKKTKSRNGYRRRKKVKNNVLKSVLLLYGIPKTIKHESDPSEHQFPWESSLAQLVSWMLFTSLSSGLWHQKSS